MDETVDKGLREARACPVCHGRFPAGTARCPRDGAALGPESHDGATTCPESRDGGSPLRAASSPADAATLDGATSQRAPCAAGGAAPQDPAALPARPDTPPKVHREEALSPTLRQEDLAAARLVGASRERVLARGSAAARPDPLVGSTLAGRFEITRKIGEGGMGAVYEARHALIGKRVAIKILLDKYAQKEAVIRRLQQEARLASAIGHPNIVDITDFGRTEDGRTFVVMEYLDGESLAQLIAREGPLAPERAIRIARQVADALAAAHEKGIVHRDVKPENVFLIERDGREFVKVVDFGISKHLKPGEEEEEAPRLTQTGMVLGTPLYMSPEQARGESDLDHRIDIYALGVILYEMVTNEVPFRGANYLGIISQVLTQEIVPPRLLRPDLAISEAFERVILKAMAKDRAERYATMRELAADLDRLVAGDQNVAASAPTSGVATVRPSAEGGVLARRTTTQIGNRQVPLSFVVVGVLAVLALGAGLASVLLHGGGTSGRAVDGGVSPDPDLASPPGVARGPASNAASQPSASLPSLVRIHVVTRPAGAVVHVGGTPKGTAPLDLVLPRADTPLELKASAKGYEDASLAHTPKDDATVVLALRERKRGGARPPRATANPPRGKEPSGMPAGPIDETAPSPYATEPQAPKKKGR